MRTRLLVAVALIPLAGCAAGAPAAPNEVTGVVLAVDARTLTDVRSFTLKTEDETLEIRVDPDEDYSFPPSHLRNHAVSGQPVRVEVEERGAELYAVEMEDA